MMKIDSDGSTATFAIIDRERPFPLVNTNFRIAANTRQIFPALTSRQPE
jgi:hypothetical protein